MKRRLTLTSDSGRRTLRVAGIIGLITLTLCPRPKAFAGFHTLNNAKAEDTLIGAFAPRKLAAHAALGRGFHYSLGDEGAMPGVDGAIGWLVFVPSPSDRAN